MIPASLREQHSRRDLALSLALLALLLWWEALGWDMAAARWYGGTDGFALRGNWWTQRLLHDGGRLLSGLALVAALILAWRPLGPTRSTRRRRYAWLGLVGACLLLVPLIKQFSRSSCPWDLTDFGGTASYVPHWMLGVVDGGPGHCFPSGHAVAAFAFLPLYFQWRIHRPLLARTTLALVLGAGALFGWAQLARGAHFPSHTLWSGWLCWAVGAIGARVLERPSLSGATAPIGWVPVSAGESAAAATARAA